MVRAKAKAARTKAAIKKPVDPAIPGKIALRSRIVTMDDAGRTLADGCIYIEDGVIRDIKNASAAPPAGFSSADVVIEKVRRLGWTLSLFTRSSRGPS